MGEKSRFTVEKTGAQAGAKAGMGGRRTELSHRQGLRGAHFSLRRRTQLVSHCGAISFREGARGYREPLWDESWRKNTDVAEVATGANGTHMHLRARVGRCPPGQTPPVPGQVAG